MFNPNQRTNTSANATFPPTSSTCPITLSSPCLSLSLQAALDEKAAMMQDNLGQEPFTDPEANPSDMVALLSTVNEGMVMMEEQAEDYNRSSQLVRKFESNKKSVENARVLLDQKVKRAIIESKACTVIAHALRRCEEWSVSRFYVLAYTYAYHGVMCLVGVARGEWQSTMVPNISACVPVSRLSCGRHSRNGREQRQGGKRPISALCLTRSSTRAPNLMDWMGKGLRRRSTRKCSCIENKR